MNRIKLLILSVFVLGSVFAQESKKPNVIYVLMDDLGIGDVRAFNPDSKIATPNLDKLAAEGMKFTDAHTSSSVCTPTRYGIITGRYNWRTNLKWQVVFGTAKALIPDDRTTVGTIMKNHGYNTAFIGKSHLGWNWALKNGKKNEGYYEGDRGINEMDIDFTKPITHSPNDIGFDYHFGSCASLDMSPYVYVEQKMPTSVPTKTTKNGGYGWWRAGLTADDFIHEDVLPNYVNRSIKYIQEKAKEDKPFFIYIPLPAPHTPILPKEKWKGKSGLNPYGDFVLMIDDYMGKLFDAVKEAGIDENTLIVFTSDNGCSPKANFNVLEEKGHYPSYKYRGTKADIFEGGHRVPFIAHWPNKIKAGSVCDKTICTTDFMATLAAIVGYELKDNEGEDSFSMMPLFEGRDKDYKREATVHHSVYGSYAIRKGDWKLIFTETSGGWSKPRGKKSEGIVSGIPKGKTNSVEASSTAEKVGFQLYNLKTDIAETTNLVEKYPKIVDELQDLMIKYLVEGRSTSGISQKNDGGDPRSWGGITFLKPDTNLNPAQKHVD